MVGCLERSLKNASYRPSSHQQRSVRMGFALSSTLQRMPPRSRRPATAPQALSTTRTRRQAGGAERRTAHPGTIGLDVPGAAPRFVVARVLPQRRQHVVEAAFGQRRARLPRPGRAQRRPGPVDGPARSTDRTPLNAMKSSHDDNRPAPPPPTAPSPPHAAETRTRRCQRPRRKPQSPESSRFPSLVSRPQRIPGFAVTLEQICRTPWPLGRDARRVNSPAPSPRCAPGPAAVRLGAPSRAGSCRRAGLLGRGWGARGRSRRERWRLRDCAAPAD